MNINNKIILITGASRGIGKTIAIEMAKLGHTVIANYNKSEIDAQLLQKLAMQNNYNIELYQADVSNRENVLNMINYILSKYNKIDVLINNAGIASYNLFTDISDSEWNYVINNNLYSVFCVTQEVVKNMIKLKNGCIINISSIWGKVGSSCESLYSLTKAGIDNLTKSLAKELGPSNIRINSIAPGFINTDMNKNFSIQEINNMKLEIPLQKLGNTLDISKCISWLIEDEYTTGQIISINGGWVIT